MSQKLLNSFVSCVELKIVLLEVTEVSKIGSSGTQLSQLNYSYLLDWFHQVSVI